MLLRDYDLRTKANRNPNPATALASPQPEPQMNQQNSRSRRRSPALAHLGNLCPKERTAISKAATPTHKSAGAMRGFLPVCRIQIDLRQSLRR